MQARFAALLFTSALLVAAPAVALVPDLPVCAVCNADVAGGDGGIWKTTNGGAADEQGGAPSSVAPAPAEASTDYLLRFDTVEGESEPPPPPPPPPNAPTAQHGVQAQPQEARMGMLLPAIQRV